MGVNPKPTADKFFPNMGDAYLIGMQNVGLQVIDTTLAATTIKTDAQIVAAPPNTSGLSYGPVVHSFGVAPSMAIAQLIGNPSQGLFAVQAAYLTADNSAVYFRPQANTGVPGVVSMRVLVFR